MRALYQRRKGRDLFDLWLGLDSGLADPDEIADAFVYYMAKGNIRVKSKLENPDFRADLEPLVSPELHYDPIAAAELVNGVLLSELP